MSTPLPRALLDWYRVNGCDDNPRSAWHTLHRNGPLALTACTSDEDYEVFANAMAVAAVLVQQLGDLIANPPPGFEVEFNGPRCSVWYGGEVVYTENIK